MYVISSIEYGMPVLYLNIFHVHFLPAPSFCPQHYSFPLHLP